MNNKNSTYHTLAKALTFEKLPEISLNLDHLDKRKLSISEMKQCIREAFKDAKAAAEVEAQELAHGWGDAEIENEINWAKQLRLKEFFEPGYTSEPVEEEHEPGHEDEDDDDDTPEEGAY